MNLYRLAQDLIQAKKDFKEKFSGLESEYNKLNCDLYEVEILEQESYYLEQCKLYNDEPNMKALEW